MFKIEELVKVTQGKLILKKGPSVLSGVSIDSRKIKRGEVFIAIKGDNFDGHNFIPAALKNGAGCIIAQRKPEGFSGVSFIQVQDTIKALGEIAHFNRSRFNAVVIAITGSNGKTTTKDMAAWVLSRKFKVLSSEGTKNNHIGLPLTLLKLNKTHEIAVLELGTNHFFEINYLSGIAAPNIGVITNIGPSHLKYLKDLKGVFREKSDLIRNLSKPKIAILNADDKYLNKELAKHDGRLFKVGIGINNKSDFTASAIRYLPDKYKFSVNHRLGFALNSLGYYNIYNGLVAVALARIFGMTYPEISSALFAFKPPYGRLNLISKKGIRFIDDTYNSNPLSLRQALDSLDKIKVQGRKIAVIGDMLELGRESLKLHEKAVKQITRSCDKLIAVGSISSLSLKSIEKRDKIISCRNARAAREVLFNNIKANRNDIILVKGSRKMKMEEVFNF